MNSGSQTTESYRWVMLSGLWLIYFCFGVVAFGLAPLVSRVAEDLSLELAGMGAILGAWPLTYIFLAMPAGAALDRFGVRRGLLLGIVFIALSAGARAVADSGIELFLAVALFGVGGPLVSIGAPKLIGRWFAERERGLAMGIYMTAPSLGAMATLMLTNSVLLPALNGSWRSVMVCQAALCVTASLAWFALTRHGASRQADEVGQPTQWRVFFGLLRTPEVRLVLMLGIGAFLFVHSFNNWLPEVLRAQGMSESTAGWWASMPVAIGILGALVIPSLATPGRRVAVLASMFGLGAVASLMLAWTGPEYLIPALIVQGIARSAMWPVAVLLLMQARGVTQENMGAAGGMFFTAGEVGGVAGPVLVGALADATGSFTAPLLCLAFLCVVLVILTLLVKVARNRQAPAS